MINIEAVKNFRQLGKKIICVGRNYKEHAAELGNKLTQKPLIFFKPTSAYIAQGEPIKIPMGCKNLQHEVEFGVIVGRRATKIDQSKAWDYVGGYALALDMTARDFQDEAKKQGHPWLMAKGFDTSCPVSDYIPKDRIPDPHNIDIWLKVNGQVKQKGNTKDMIFDIPTMLAHATQFVTMEPGDLLLTGTPSGVTTLKPGDEIECGLGNILTMKFPVQE